MPATCPHCGNDLPEPKNIVRRCVACGRNLTRHDGLLCRTCVNAGHNVVPLFEENR